MLHGLRLILPQAKILLILRRPEDRLYSSYKQYTRLSEQSPDRFHDIATNQIATFQSCLENHDFDFCFYPNSVQRLQAANDLRRSLYYGFVVDLLKIFPKNQVHVIKGESYYGNRIEEMRKIVEFLGVSKMDAATEERLIHKEVSNAGSHRYEKNNVSEPNVMLEKTRKMLREFYKFTVGR